ncbi:unnamed protein product [Rotaria sordida]|uniref:WD repeat-containing protein 89 n=1 Tax=Rotaria sordida TaxID=392033 RepID=A0A818LIB0_9BILA|nr:unnamed protein product [Rotaria sordida]CAF3572639.1 unnamed protein product [Rotaria sordida]
MKVKPTISNTSSSSLLKPLIDINKSSVRSSPETNDCYAVDLTLNSTNNHIAVLTIPSTIQLFDASTLKPLSSLSSTTNNFDNNNSSSSIKIHSIQYAYISPYTLFASTNKNLVLVWDTRTPQLETIQLNGCADTHEFLSVTCNNEDQLVAAGTELRGDENVAIAFWDIRAPINKQLLGYYTESHSDDIIQVKFSRMNSTKLLSGSTDGLVCLYDVSKLNEDDALEQVYNANGPVAKCGFAQYNTIYATTASNGFFIWSTSDENQQLLIQGDTDNDLLTSEISSEKIDTSLKSSTIIHHLSSSHATIVDILSDCNIQDLLPSVTQETKSCWPLLMCDHMGKMNITLVSSNESQPTIFPLDSPHSETLRAAVTYRSTFYSCGDDGQLIQWQPSSSSSPSSTYNSNENQQQTSDTECSHRSSLTTVHRVPANNSSQLSRTTSIHEIISNPETAELFLEYLMNSPQTASLGAVYAIILVLNEKKDDVNQLHDIGRAAYKTYIENETILPWLPTQRRIELRDNYRRKQFDEHFFDGVLDDLLIYIENQTDVFRQFLNSRLWNEYRRGKFSKNHAQIKSTSTLGNNSSSYQNENELKRSRKLHSSSLSLQTKTKSYHHHHHHHQNRSVRVESTSIKKTRVAYFLPGSDTPFVIQVAVPSESITLNDILPRVHTSSTNQRNNMNTNNSFDYFVKHRATNENWLGGDIQFINEKIEDFDIPLPNIDGTVVIRILNNN